MSDRDKFPPKPRFFGLHFSDGAVVVQQGNTSDEIGEITALDQEPAQSERFLSISMGEERR